MEKDFDKIVELNERGRCINCKIKKYDMITCERCREFKYCSVNCLEDDRKNHKKICDVVGLKKGLLTILTDKQKKAQDNARLLNDDGSLKIEEWKINKKQNETESGGDLTQDKFKTGKKKNGRSKNGNGKNTGKMNGNSSKNKQEKSVESLIAGGKFGGTTKVTPQEESGESFGKSWWKGKIKHVQEEPKAGPKKASSRQTEAKLTFKDFYNDSEDDETDKKTDDNSEDDETDKKTDLKQENVEGAGSNPNPAVQSGKPLTETDMAMVKYDPKKAEEEMKRSASNQNRPVRGMCLYCKKTGSVLKCSRCKIATYCSKVCQLAHYQLHKDVCRLKGRFEDALAKVPTILILTLRLMGGPFEISALLEDILNPFQAMLFNLRPDTAIMVEIIAIHPVFVGAVVRDASGEVTRVMFNVNTLVYKHVTMCNRFPFIKPIHLITCIRPRNFILLLAPRWSFFPDGKIGICVRDLEDVHFVFMED